MAHIVFASLVLDIRYEGNFMVCMSASVVCLVFYTLQDGAIAPQEDMAI